jgi:hypothetical protein
MKSININLSLSAVETVTIIKEPVIIKGESTINFILTGIPEDINKVLFVDIDWGDKSQIESFRRDTVFNYKTKSIFNEVLYGKIGGSVCVLYNHTYFNSTSNYALGLTPKIKLTYDNNSIVTYEQPLHIYWGSFYDEIKELVAINSQILPLSTSPTFVNLESQENICIIPSILTTTNNTVTSILTEYLEATPPNL